MSADNNNILATLLEPLLLVAGDRVAFADGQERLEYWSAFQVCIRETRGGCFAHRHLGIAKDGCMDAWMHGKILEHVPLIPAVSSLVGLFY